MLADKWLLPKFWLEPYLSVEPENTIVVEHEGAVKGYLVAAFRDDFKKRALRKVLPWGLLLGLRLLAGFYAKQPGMRTWAKWVLFRSWREIPKTPPGTPHFHFNLDADIRGEQGIGFHLLDEFERRVKASGIDRWHTIVFSQPKKRSANVYERMGFEIFASSACTLFGDETKYLTIVKRLDKNISKRPAFPTA